jgi:hypothetical protein
MLLLLLLQQIRLDGRRHNQTSSTIEQTHMIFAVSGS